MAKDAFTKKVLIYNFNSTMDCYWLHGYAWRQTSEEPEPTLTLIFPQDMQLTFTLDSVNKNNHKDLIIQPVESKPGVLRLCPVDESLWKPVLTTANGFQCISNTFVQGSLNREEHTCNGFHCEWPPDAKEWTERNRPGKWPSKETVDIFVRRGCHVEPVQSQDDTLWQYSFVLADDLAYDYVLGVQRKLFFFISVELLKFALESQNILTYVHYRSVLFRLFENKTVEMLKRKPAECLVTLLEILDSYVSRKQFPDYYIPKRNLLENVDDTSVRTLSQRLYFLRRYLFQFVCLMFDSNRVDGEDVIQGTVTELTKLVIERPHETTSYGYAEWIVPICASCMRRNVQKKFHKAALVQARSWSLDFKENWNEANITEDKFIEMTLNYLDTDSRWMFAFYVDCKTGSTWLKKLETHAESVPLFNILQCDYDVLEPLLGFSTSGWEVKMPTELITMYRTIWFVNNLTRLIKCDLESPEVAIDVLWFFLQRNTHDFLLRVESENRDRTYAAPEVGQLYTLFNMLYTLLKEQGATDSFGDMMRLFEEVCNHMSWPHAYNKIAKLWDYFEEHEKAREARMKANVLQKDALSY